MNLFLFLFLLIFWKLKWALVNISGHICIPKGHIHVYLTENVVEVISEVDVTI